ncbi:leucine-rich repeats and immunoglobulin-like domains protein 2 isoform X2 [Sitodiplosis mosellana]|uniref:leucine-rich repeats and immunoglobulin-like domains protein 2 isoform X2 n=1 Tax=Sitodiplosis mosellana TaxID=263140 RepID=UPI002443BB50|nr:leucine-rich repeats and immunoglobulin-like domains protein 2 isoform X2 [Sitodiplosis mosellana]XP_055300619.1 leucine-rich repeats and immunoglobulin-like domains protein 2 isoform X2 [Sitodiplosis mosellana]
MRKQFCWHILAIILLCICLPFGLCDKNGQRNDRTSAEAETTLTTKTTATSRNGKFRMPKHGLPLRDDSDYVRENEPNSNEDDDYDDDEYYDGEQSDPSKNRMKKKNNKVNGGGNDDDEKNDVQQSPEIVEQAQSARTQIIQRPKELTDAEIAALLQTISSQQQPATPNADVTAPADTTTTAPTELCPKECSCLNDFMTCTRPHLKHLPKVPQFIQSLELPQNNFDAVMCEQGIRNLPNLIDLNLNDNKLERIPIMHGVAALETLELANNEIGEITLAALQLLPNLKHLDLSRNMILAIATNSFPKQNNIQKLFLNNNQITTLDRRAFEPLVQLNELKINKNRISELPVGLFAKLKKLKKLDLANNHLTKIEKGGLLNITALSKLNLANNSIHTIGKDCWEFTQRIIHLDLSQNQLAEINVGTFDKLNKLKILDLHANQITTISSGALNATYNLESLDLSQNRISAAIEDSYGPFASLNKLDTIYLNDNNIKAINKNAFLGLVSLIKLDISNNNITTIQDGAFQDQYNTQLLQHLHINSTDLICDCHVSWFYFWAKNAQSTGVKRQSGERKGNIDVRCAFPFSLRNRRLLQLQKDDLTCHETPKPQMVDEPKSSILAIKGTNQTIECTAFVTVGSDIVFTWKHDNNDIDAALIESKTRRKDENRLRIKERMVERRREANRSPLRTKVSAPKVPLWSSGSKFSKFDDSEDEYEGDDEEVGGELDEGEYETENHYDGEEDSIDEVVATVEDIEANIPINSTMATSRLHLINVDSRTAGRYQCIASNNFGTAYSQKFKVTVASYPVFTKQPTNITVRTSERIQLDCAVDGDPKPQIYWQFNFGNDFPAARERRMQIMDNDESFIIDNAKTSDRGIYTCTAENSAGIIHTNVTVEITEPLTYIKPMEYKDVLVGEYTILECLNSGPTLSDIRWFKNSKEILASESRYLLAKENQLLIIVKTAEEDAGLYTCELKNTLGIERSLIQLKVRTEPVATNEVVPTDAYSRDKITAIIIITVVVCAIGTSIVWIIILYQTKKENGCGPDDADRNDGTDIENHITKEGILKSVNVSMLPKGDEKPVQAMRTATISRCHGVLRSNSDSSCGHSSLGVSDDIFRRYKDDCSMSNAPLQPHRNGTDTEEDDANNDHDALLGTTYFNRYPKTVKCSDNDSFVVQIDDGCDGNSSQHDTSAGNTTTAECGDFDDGQHSSTKTKTSASLSSSCHSIPALPLNSSHEFDLNRSHCNDSLASSNSPFTSNQNVSSVPNKPVVHPIGKPKPTIQTNKLNELMSTFK